MHREAGLTVKLTVMETGGFRAHSPKPFPPGRASGRLRTKNSCGDAVVTVMDLCQCKGSKTTDLR